MKDGDLDLAVILLAERSLNASQRTAWLDALVQLLYERKLRPETLVVLRDKLGSQERDDSREVICAQLFMCMMLAWGEANVGQAGAMYADILAMRAELPPKATEMMERLGEKYLRLDTVVKPEELDEHIEFVTPLSLNRWGARANCRAGAVLAKLLAQEGLRLGYLEDLSDALADAPLVGAEVPAVAAARKRLEELKKDRWQRWGGVQREEFIGRSSFQLVQLVKGAAGVTSSAGQVRL